MKPVVLGLVVVLFVSGLVVGPRVMERFGDDCPHCDERSAEEYLFVAYPKWRRDHTTTCPASVDELSPYIGRRDASDGMGDSIELTCDANRVVVHPRGADGLANTDDDFWRTFP